MSAAKRRKLDQDVMSNGSAIGGGASRTGAGRRAAAAAAQQVTAGHIADLGGSTGINRGGRSANGAGAAAIRNGGYAPVLSLATLPISTLSRYCLHYGCVPPTPLTMAQAIHPTPPLPLELALAGSNQVIPRRRASLVPDRKPRAAVRSGVSSSTIKSGNPADATKSQGAQEGHASNNAVDGVNSGPKQHYPAATMQVDTASRVHPDEAVAQSGSSKSKLKRSRSASTTFSEQAQRELDGSETNWGNAGEPFATDLQGMTAWYGGEEQARDRLAKAAQAHWDKITVVKEAETIVNFAYRVRMGSKVLRSVPPI